MNTTNGSRMADEEPINRLAKFFQNDYDKLVDSPNGSGPWWHSMPLPDGSRVNGANQDKDLQFKMWNGMQIARDGGLKNKRVLDIGANDGFFSLASLMAGAIEVTAIDMDWGTWPKNISYASNVWHVGPRIVTADFRTYGFGERYDIILFLGVLYHLENVFDCMSKLRSLLNKDGAIYMETQMSSVESALPIFEYASDVYGTIARQDKGSLEKVGISNYLFPNESAIRNLAHSYDLQVEALDGLHNLYTKENPTRRLFKFTKE